jgi:succinyl-CoA:(S)-malate CoA-transferase subunit A
MGRPDLLERFGDQKPRLANRKIVLAEVEAWTSSMPRDDVIRVCTENGVPAGAVNTIADIFADPHVQARGSLATVQVPGIGPVTVPNVFPKLSETPGEIDSLGPALGDANDAIYRGELGLTDEEMHKLKRDGAI